MSCRHLRRASGSSAHPTGGVRGTAVLLFWPIGRGPCTWYGGRQGQATQPAQVAGASSALSQSMGPAVVTSSHLLQLPPQALEEPERRRGSPGARPTPHTSQGPPMDPLCAAQSSAGDAGVSCLSDLCLTGLRWAGHRAQGAEGPARPHSTRILGCWCPLTPTRATGSWSLCPLWIERHQVP